MNTYHDFLDELDSLTLYIILYYIVVNLLDAVILILRPLCGVVFPQTDGGISWSIGPPLETCDC